MNLNWVFGFGLNLFILHRLRNKLLELILATLNDYFLDYWTSIRAHFCGLWKTTWSPISAPPEFEPTTFGSESERSIPWPRTSTWVYYISIYVLFICSYYTARTSDKVKTIYLIEKLTIIQISTTKEIPKSTINLNI